LWSGDLAALRLDPLDRLLSLVIDHSLFLKVLDLGLVSAARMFIDANGAGAETRIEGSLNLPLRSIREIVEDMQVRIFEMQLPHHE
jgi:hypothetical protein